MPNANIGEWSEIYALLKVLSERGVSGADKDLQKLNSVFYSVHSIRRIERGRQLTLFPDVNGTIVSKILDGQTNTTTLQVPRNTLESICTDLLEEMKDAKGVFDVPDVRTLMSHLGLVSLKSPSKNKGDIELEINDKVTNQLNRVEFSLKSYLGGLPTLLNAGQTTKFRFELVEFSGDAVTINADNKPSNGKVQRKANAVFANSKQVLLSKIGPDAKEKGVFYRNLQLLDFEMPQMLAALLFLFQKGEGRTVAELVPRLISQKSDFGLHPDLDEQMLEIKVKNLLTSSALGMVPGSHWNGRISVDGGYIIVRQDGELVCFHVYNFSDLADYLYNNICFETASTSRYGFGEVFFANNKAYFDLVLQLRFKKP